MTVAQGKGSRYLVVPFGTSGMVRMDRPLVLVPLVPHTPTLNKLSYLVVPNGLSQLSFLRFVFRFLITIPFFEKTLVNEKFVPKYHFERSFPSVSVRS